MKTQKMSSVKKGMTAVMAALILLMSACNSEKGHATNEKDPISASQKKPQPPGTDIHTAAFMGNLDALRQHIEAGSDLDQKDEYGSTPLIIAVTFGKAEVARELVEAGADINCKNNDGSTPLHTAAFLCRTEILEMLLENGADKNIMNNFGSTALESVSGPFDSVKGIYDQFNKDLGPLGLRLDLEYLKKTRPTIAEMLQ